MTIQKVLVIDDSKTELMALTDILQRQGMQVRTAENGEDAMKRLAEDKPDLILMDVVMPGQNGFQLTRAISRDPRYADVPIIMCTSKNQETDRVWGMRQGARGYITKPVDAAELQAKIAALYRRRCLWRTAKPSEISNPDWPGACKQCAMKASVSPPGWLYKPAGGTTCYR